jgi:hypothetical protein
MGRNDIGELQRLGADNGWTVTPGRSARASDAVVGGVVEGVAWQLTGTLYDLEGPGMDELCFATGPIPGAEAVSLRAESRSIQGSGVGGAEIAIVAIAATMRLLGRKRRVSASVPAHSYLPELSVVDPLGILGEPEIAALVRAAPHDRAKVVTNLAGGVVGLGNTPAGFSFICRGRLDEPTAIRASVNAGMAVVERLLRVGRTGEALPS